MNFLKRIDFEGDVAILLQQISDDYQIGKMLSYKVVEVGYEDLNIIMHTDTATYFIKLFANFRDRKNCERYVNLMVNIVDKGIKHPKLYQSNQGYLHSIDNVRLCVMDYIDGNTFFDLRTKPSKEELAFLANQCALISEVPFETEFVYDSWAIVNFLEEYEKTKGYLQKEYLELIAPLIKP